MTEEEIQALQEREKELTEKVANLEQDKANTVSELIEKRKSEQSVKEELDKLKEAQKQTQAITDPEELVERVLTKRSEVEIKDTIESIKSNLKNIYPEFSKEKDAAGILIQDFERQLNKFNFQGLKTKEEVEQRFSEVYNFWKRSKSNEKDSGFYEGSRSNLGVDAKEDDSATLNATETKLIKELGWTKDKYLAQKAKRPHFVASLLQHRS